MRTRILVIGLTLLVAVGFPAPEAQAVVYIETIEVPLQVNAPRSLLGRPKTDPRLTSPIISERYLASKDGKRYLRRTADKLPNETNRIVTFKCPEVLARANSGNTELVIDISKQRVYLMVGGLMAAETQVSTARAGKFTPRGTFSMTERVRSGKISNLYDVVMPYWMRLGETEFGVHGGYLPGYPASAGCIRLPMQFAELVYRNSQRGTRVKIYTRWRPPALRPGYLPPARPPNVDAYGQFYRRIRI